MSDEQLAFMIGPTFRGLWVSDVYGVGRQWTVTWVLRLKMMETPYQNSPAEALQAAMNIEIGWGQAPPA